MNKHFFLSRSLYERDGRARIKVLIVALVLLALSAVVIPVAIRRRSDSIDVKKAVAVAVAIREAGNHKLMGSEYVVILNGRLEGGIAVVLRYSDDATFWIKDDVTYAVNDAAHSLLPAAPQAPAQITHEAIRAVAK
ncbi:MAG: hypothetical protein WC655_08590 [Candidatus Hydrogenedentales bacterium]